MPMQKAAMETIRSVTQEGRSPRLAGRLLRMASNGSGEEPRAGSGKPAELRRGGAAGDGERPATFCAGTFRDGRGTPMFGVEARRGVGTFGGRGAGVSPRAPAGLLVVRAAVARLGGSAGIALELALRNFEPGTGLSIGGGDAVREGPLCFRLMSSRVSRALELIDSARAGG